MPVVQASQNSQFYDAKITKILQDQQYEIENLNKQFEKDYSQILKTLKEADDLEKEDLYRISTGQFENCVLGADRNGAHHHQTSYINVRPAGMDQTTTRVQHYQCEPSSSSSHHHHHHKRRQQSRYIEEEMSDITSIQSVTSNEDLCHHAHHMHHHHQEVNRHLDEHDCHHHHHHHCESTHQIIEPPIISNSKCFSVGVNRDNSLSSGSTSELLKQSPYGQAFSDSMNTTSNTMFSTCNENQNRSKVYLVPSRDDMAPQQPNYHHEYNYDSDQRQHRHTVKFDLPPATTSSTILNRSSIIQAAPPPTHSPTRISVESKSYINNVDYKPLYFKSSSPSTLSHHNHNHHHQQNSSSSFRKATTANTQQPSVRVIMVDSKLNSNTQSPQQAAAAAPTTPSNDTGPRKDHYSYSYKYKTAADPESGVPGVNTVEVNESVTEEIGPDGSKIIRRHQQEKQINKITQVVTQRVIKRQYIDPATGQIIEYDPNNELFANLPPETVFEEHTIISDDSSGNPPIVTTTTLSKTAPNSLSNKNLTSGATGALVDQFSSFGIGGNESNGVHKRVAAVDYVDNGSPGANAGIYSSVKFSTTDNVVSAASAMKIKSHPEDNQGYPEERNMDYDPDDSYHDDDSPYEGLVQSNRDDDDDDERHNRHRRHNHHHHHHHHHHQQQQGPKRSDHLHVQHSQCSAGSSTGSSSSPIMYDPNIDMPQVSNAAAAAYHKASSTRGSYHVKTEGPSSSYATILPSSNICPSNLTPRSNVSSAPSQPAAGQSFVVTTTATSTQPQSNYQTIGSVKYAQHQQPGGLSVDPYYQSSSSAIMGQQQMPSSSTGTYSRHHVQIHHQQQASPSLNNSNDYDTHHVVNGNGMCGVGAPGSVTVGGWRNPTLPEVIEYLSHSSNEIKSNAAAYLQHLCYQDDSIKAETRLLGGVGKLVHLLNSDVCDVHKNACGALRNLSYGKNNDENKIEIRNAGGIPSLVRLLKRTQDETVRESITAVLWNLSSCEEIKEPILFEGLNSIVKYIIVPYSSIEVLNSNSINNRTTLNHMHHHPHQLKSSQRLLASDYSSYPTVLTNATGVLRNCSSNLHFSSCYEARKKLRDCEGLIEALIRIVDQAVDPYVNDHHRGQSNGVNLDLVVKDNMNSKCLENCMCILRNLSFRLQEIIDPNYDRDVKPYPYDDKTTKCVGAGGTSTNGRSGSKKRSKNIEEDFLNNVYPYNMPVPNEGKPQEVLWSLVTLNKYLVIIKESTVRDTIEAAVGCLQNLTACYWRASVVIRQEIRKLKGLPTLVHLLKSDEYEDEPIVSVTAIALRNLAIDAKNRELIGKYAMKDLVAKLPDPQRPMPARLSVLNEDTITAVLACINECIKCNDDFVKSCYSEGGVKRMMFITRNAQYFPIKIVKYAAHVLASMWKHKNLHDLLKKDGYKETDFTSVAKQMGLKSCSSSPANTLHRPRGDVNVKPSHHGTSQKKTKGSKTNGKTSKQAQQPELYISSTTTASGPQQPMQLNEMPIYSQVQKPTSGGNNRNIIIGNGGQTNADSWV